MSGFEFGNITSSPFWLGTLILAFFGWILAVIGVALQTAPAYLVWNVIYLLFLILIAAFTIASDALPYYRLSLLTFTAIGLVYATNWANLAVLSDNTDDKVAGSGFAILSGILFSWVFAFGAESGSAVGESLSGLGVKPMANTVPAGQLLGAGHYSGMKQQGGIMVRQGSGSGGMQQIPLRQTPSSHSVKVVSTPGQQVSLAAADQSRMDVSPDAQYTYKAAALYSYTASPDDPNELGFVKGEVLDIVDNKGKWWQAKKSDGSIGIVPINYLQLQ